jgi:hypothetical protein
LLISGAAGMLGALTGFLFGIPRTLQGGDAKTPADGAASGQNPPEAAAYVANTNLEQISDWLTKILVGVGLTQLGDAPTKLGAVATKLAPALGADASATALIGSGLVYFAVCGFLFAYLWTRLYLAAALRGADLDAIGRKLDELGSQSARDAHALELVHAELESTGELTAEKKGRIASAVKAASPSVRVALFIKAKQQRQQNWKLPADKPRMERTIPVFQSLAQMDDQNFESLAQLGYALKDQTVPAWAEAQKALSKAIHLRGPTSGNEWMYYEFNRAICSINLDAGYKDGKPSAADVRELILADLKLAMTSGRVREILVGDKDVKAWATLNGVDLSKPW